MKDEYNFESRLGENIASALVGGAIVGGIFMVRICAALAGI
jgi:hypothetical protein